MNGMADGEVIFKSFINHTNYYAFYMFYKSYMYVLYTSIILVYNAFSSCCIELSLYAI